MNTPESFLSGKYWGKKDFRDATEEQAKRSKTRTGETIPNDPTTRIEAYLKRFTDILERDTEEDKTRGVSALLRLLERKYVIKEEHVSDEYLKGVLLGNFAEQKGYDTSVLQDSQMKEEIIQLFEAETGKSFSTYSIPESERAETVEMVIQDQRTRLHTWFDYLTSEEAEHYPPAYRYWAFAEMLKLGSYDAERQQYNKRTETTAASFPELDQQALALTLDEIQKKQQGTPSEVTHPNEDQEAVFQKRLTRERFGELYAFIQEHLKTLRLPDAQLETVSGKWLVFPKGSDPHEVTTRLSGFHTGWCIAGAGTAQNYLKTADLHIYFSEDATSAPTIPRACVVHDPEHGRISEVRGIINDEKGKQHLDDYVTPQVSEHLNTLSGGEAWQTQMEDMQHLALIHQKYLQRETFSTEDIRFLYELDRPIHSTGYNKDPRIAEILSERDPREDISSAFGIAPERVSLTKTEALSGNIRYHYGDLDLKKLTTAEGLTLPESIGGTLNLNSLTTAEGLTLPQSIGEDLYLSSLTTEDKALLREQFPHLAGKI